MRRDAHALMFAALYDATERRDPEAVLAAFIAADVEYSGPLRLSSRQNVLLVEVYESLGGHMPKAGPYEHAAPAYHRAMTLHRVSEDGESEPDDHTADPRLLAPRLQRRLEVSGHLVRLI
ncbi:hypothetical protein [Nocardia sp. NPDC057353]|uniref:hypothetical protein n=1 Tax=Nocardia sp. NPDC057353 TaxID=3346104 RepID=UPI00362EEBE6